MPIRTGLKAARGACTHNGVKSCNVTPQRVSELLLRRRKRHRLLDGCVLQTSQQGRPRRLVFFAALPLHVPPLQVTNLHNRFVREGISVQM